MASHRPHEALFRAALEAPRHAAELLEVLLPDALLGVVARPSLALHSGSGYGHDEEAHSKLLFRADIAGSPGFVGFIFELHSADDGGLPLRVLGYQCRIWERHWRAHPGEPLPALVLVVLSHDRSSWRAPSSLPELLSREAREHEALQALMPSFHCIVRDLSQFSDQDLKARSLSTFPTLVLWALRDARTPGQILLTLDHWADALTHLADTEGGEAALEQLFVYLLNVVEERAFDPLQARLTRLAPAAAPALITVAERLRAEGSRNGAAYGLAQGRRECLEKLMTQKFGPLSDALPAWIQAADVALLDRWLERVLTAQSPHAVLEL